MLHMQPVDNPAPHMASSEATSSFSRLRRGWFLLPTLNRADRTTSLGKTLNESAHSGSCSFISSGKKLKVDLLISSEL